MQHSPRHYAHALYLLVRDGSERQTREAIKRFVANLHERRLDALLPGILRELPAAIREIEGIEQVTVESARDIDKELVGRILAELGIDPDRADVRTRIAPELIGGVRVVRQDRVFDGTVKAKLDRLTNAFTA